MRSQRLKKFGVEPQPSGGRKREQKRIPCWGLGIRRQYNRKYKRNANTSENSIEIRDVTPIFTPTFGGLSACFGPANLGGDWPCEFRGRRRTARWAGRPDGPGRRMGWTAARARLADGAVTRKTPDCRMGQVAGSAALSVVPGRRMGHTAGWVRPSDKPGSRKTVVRARQPDAPGRRMSQAV